jgi:two-component system, LytTR family, response regulator
MNYLAPTRVVIVEDQLAIRKDIELLVSQQPGFIVIGSCGGVQEAIQMIKYSTPDILLLDINLGDGSGFDILNEFGNLCWKVIFLTAHSEHAIKAIKSNAIDYLLKPINPLELRDALLKAINTPPLSFEDIKLALDSLRKADKRQKIVLRFYDVWEVVYLDDIIYCEGVDGYTAFYLTGGKKIVSSHHLKEYEEHLPSSQFLRPHQTYIVNNSYIQRYKPGGQLILKDGTEIPVSRRGKEIVRRYLDNF